MQISIIYATNFGETLGNSCTFAILKTVLTQSTEHCTETTVKNRSKNDVKKWLPFA